MPRPAYIVCADQSEVLTSDVEYVELLSDKVGELGCWFVTFHGQRLPIDYAQAAYFAKLYNLAVKHFSAK